MLGTSPEKGSSPRPRRPGGLSKARATVPADRAWDLCLPSEGGGGRWADESCVDRRRHLPALQDLGHVTLQARIFSAVPWSPQPLGPTSSMWIRSNSCDHSFFRSSLCPSVLIPRTLSRAGTRTRQVRYLPSHKTPHL